MSNELNHTPFPSIMGEEIYILGPVNSTPHCVPGAIRSKIMVGSGSGNASTQDISITAI